MPATPSVAVGGLRANARRLAALVVAAGATADLATIGRALVTAGALLEEVAAAGREVGPAVGLDQHARRSRHDERDDRQESQQAHERDGTSPMLERREAPRRAPQSTAR